MKPSWDLQSRDQGGHASDCSLLKWGGQHHRFSFPSSSHSQACLWKTRMPQKVAVSLAEPSAKDQWLTPNVGDFSTADRCYFSLSPLTQAGETADFRQDALPKAWCNPEKKNLFGSQTRIWCLPIQSDRDQWLKRCRYRRYVEFTHI